MFSHALQAMSTTCSIYIGKVALCTTLSVVAVPRSAMPASEISLPVALNSGASIQVCHMLYNLTAVLCSCVQHPLTH